MKIYIPLLLLLLQKAAATPQKCKSEILESNGIISNLEPQKVKMAFCPNIKLSCCPAYEQFKMFDNYASELKPHYKDLILLIKKELELLKDIVTNAAGELTSKVAGMPKGAKQLQAEDILSKLKKKDIKAIMEVAQRHQKSSMEYVASLKSGYFCIICDYRNHGFIDTVKKTVSISDQACDDLVKNTILYSNAINNGLAPYIEGLSAIDAKINNKEESITIPGLGELGTAIAECADEYIIMEDNLSACKKYCSYFKLNSDIPAYEGYPEVFANAIAALGKKAGGAPPAEGDAEAKGDAAEAKTEAKPETAAAKARILSAGMGLSHKTKKRTKKTKRDRILAEEEPAFVDELNPEVRAKHDRADIFDLTSYDPEYDDAMVVSMFQFQQALNNDNADDILGMIKEQYVKTYEVAIEDIEDHNIFKTANNIRANVAEFKTQVHVGGIETAEIIKEIPWDIGLHDIVMSLNGSLEAGGVKETIEPLILENCNEIDNQFVKDFHMDPSMSFKAYEIISPNYIEVQKSVVEAGIAQQRAAKEKLLVAVLEAETANKDKEAVAKKLAAQEDAESMGFVNDDGSLDGEAGTGEGDVAGDPAIDEGGETIKIDGE